MTPATLHTARLLLRPWQRSDRDTFLALHGDPEVARYMGGEGTDPRALFHAVFALYLADEPRHFECWAVADASGVIGHAELKQSIDTGPDELELVYALRPQVWGQGYATELVAHLAARAQALDRRPIATVHPDNAASLRVLAKCGFVHAAKLEDEKVLWRWAE